MGIETHSNSSTGVMGEDAVANLKILFSFLKFHLAPKLNVQDHRLSKYFLIGFFFYMVNQISCF